MMTAEEHLSVPYVMVLESIAGPDGDWLRQASYPELPGCIAQAPTPINLRENFNALALFSPTVKTDSNGRAVVDIKLPDNLTRYRITAVSVDIGSSSEQPRVCADGRGAAVITPGRPIPFGTTGP